MAIATKKSLAGHSPARLSLFSAQSCQSWEDTQVSVPTARALTPLYDAKDPLYLIPTGEEMKLNVSITYVVRTYDGRVSGGYTEVEQTISKTISFAGGLLSNKQYGLNIYLGLTSVKFTASVAAWGDDDGTTEAEERAYVDLPINVND